MGLRVTTTSRSLQITVGFETLRFAAVNHEEFHPDMDGETLSITDAKAFAKEIAMTLNDELDETGRTLVTNTLDAAIMRCLENGCESAEIVPPEAD